LSKIRLKHDNDSYLKFVLQDPVGMFCYFIMKLVDPKWTKEIEEKYKVREGNTHYERKEGYELEEDDHDV